MSDFEPTRMPTEVKMVVPPGRKKLSGMALSIMLVVFLGTIAWFTVGSRPREPVYQGKPLSWWLDLYTPRIGRTPMLDSQKPSEAVRGIGTNSIPILLRMLRAKDTSTLRLKLARFVDVQSQDGVLPQTVNKALIKIRPTLAEELNLQAARGLQALHHDAKSAVPAVIQIYEARISPSSEGWAAYALGAIGGEQAFFALLRGTTNSNPQIRKDSLVALPGAHVEPELTVFALTNAFADPDGEVRLWACNRFGLVGSEAFEARTKALPALQLLLRDSDARVRREAAGVLKEIDQVHPANQP